ncbi:MAG: substrate-binding domain-containing protein [Oscillospiraceae bacterium]|nr:substrate-binding domain-containing protein [Oscillospiraceae bacterium]
MLDDISDYIYGAMLAGIQTVAHRHGYVCTFFSRQPSGATEASHLELFESRQVDGLLFATFHKRDPLEVRLLAQSQKPIVLIGEHHGALYVPSVDIDNALGTMEEVSYMIRQGRRRIAYLSGPEMMSASEARLNGYEQALEMSGTPIDAALIEPTLWSVEGGYKATKRLMARTTFDALVGSNSYCSYGAVLALKEAGWSIPEDVAVAAFDDDALCRYTSPSLTTLSQPLTRMGEIAAEQLAARIREENVDRSAIYVQPQLILRASTAARTDAFAKEG